MVVLRLVEMAPLTEVLVAWCQGRMAGPPYRGLDVKWRLKIQVEWDSASSYILAV